MRNPDYANPDAVQAEHRKAVRERSSKPGLYLLIADTSDISYSGLEPVAGLAPTGSRRRQTADVGSLNHEHSQMRLTTQLQLLRGRKIHRSQRKIRLHPNSIQIIPKHNLLHFLIPVRAVNQLPRLPPPTPRRLIPLCAWKGESPGNSTTAPNQTDSTKHATPQSPSTPAHDKPTPAAPLQANALVKRLRGDHLTRK